MPRYSQEAVTLNVSDAVWSTDDLSLLLRVTVEDVFGGSLRADTFFEQMDCSGEPMRGVFSGTVCTLHRLVDLMVKRRSL